MKFEKPKQILMLFLIIISCYLCLVETAFGAERFLVSIPAKKILVHLKHGRRISGYTINLINSEVYGLMQINFDWLITISTHHFPLMYERIKAGAGHDSSSLTDADVKNGVFDKFLIVEREIDKGDPIRINAEFEINIPPLIDNRMVKVLISSDSMVITPLDDISSLLKPTQQ